MKEIKQTAQLNDGPGLEAFLPDTSQGFVAQAGIALADGAGPADADARGGVPPESLLCTPDSLLEGPPMPCSDMPGLTIPTVPPA